MTVVRMSWKGNPFEDMSDLEKEIFNLGMNLMGMPEDHPNYESDSKKLKEMLKEHDRICNQ